MQLSGRVLITGGSGSLGTAILERAEQEKWDVEFTVLARNETKMGIIRSRFPKVNCQIGDVRDGSHLETIFPGHDLIIHAAAIKIVPVAEANPVEAVKTNVIGSMNVAKAAIESGIKKVIGISTDKVCGPTYYGTTKRLMEGVFREARTWGNTDFVLCRYGNVLKSNNSIVPLFEKQIREDKSFTITDLRMSRFWLSMKQAIDLILFTNEWASNGQIFIPKAPAMKIVDVAKTLDPEREIKEIGIRPGERVHETLLVREEALHTAEYNGHFVVYPPTEKDTSLFGQALSNYPHLPYQYEYTSNNPDHWLTGDELRQMLKDS
jgi:UDP-N-acetylglucosamine 4,6-dehydratase/5-epimerase